MSAKRSAGTAGRILDAAERLVQVRGFNAFSYADISKELGIQKASLHHHFATKAELGLALVARYRRAFLASLGVIDADGVGGVERLERYAALYGSVLRRKRMCMCGMLATDAATLPKAMRQSVAEFFMENKAWLARVLDEGRTRGELRFEGTADTTAAFFLSSLEGAMLVARGSGQFGQFDRVTEHLLATVCPPAAKPAGRTKPAGRSGAARRAR